MRQLHANVADRKLAVTVAAALLGLGACNESYSPSVANPVHFSESRFAYEIRNPAPQLIDDDDEFALFDVSGIVAVEAGYIVVDARNHHLVLFDHDLNPVRIIGRQGEGPGEFQFPFQIALAEDRVVVLDVGLSRVSFLSPGGSFIESVPVQGNPNDLAYHPELGLLVVGDAFPNHYLMRVRAGDHTPFAPIPVELRPDPAGPFQSRTDIVTVTPDGGVHILDGRELALVSYTDQGELTGIRFLPARYRSDVLLDRASWVKAIGGPEVSLGSHILYGLQPLSEDRILVGAGGDPELMGYVFDLEELAALPVLKPDELRVRPRLVFRGENVAFSFRDELDRDFLATGQLKLVERAVESPGEDRP